MIIIECTKTAIVFSFMNYAALGAAVAHEIGHTFDSSGEIFFSFTNS